MKCLYRLLLVSTCLFSLLQTQAALAENVVKLAAGERPPYIGATLPNNGYVVELAQEAFKRRGYQARVEFYPWARAQRMAADGEIDGVVPVYDAVDAPDNPYIYSHPFPGDAIGLLKKKSLKISYSKEDVKDQRALFSSLKRYRFGVARDGVNLQAFDAANFLVKDVVNDNIQNLDKVALGRIDFAVIDKYTAADLMVGRRPHLIGQLEFMYPPLAERDFFIAFSKKGKNPQKLLNAFNEGLAEMQQDGSLLKIREKHGLFSTPNVGRHKVRLTIGTVNNSDMLVMRDLSKTFEAQHPNVELEWRTLDENTLRLRLLGDLAIADGQFDIMTIGIYEAPIWAKQGWLAPLQALPASYELQDILPTVRQGLSYNGRLFALPFYAESSMTFYRKDLFAKAGLTMPAQPKYDDILKFASQIHNPGAGVYGICLRGKAGWGENMAYLTTLVNTFGGRWFNEAWRPELDSPVWNKAILFYKQLLKNYGPPHPEQNGFNENLALFAAGRCGMWIDATVAAGMLFDRKRSTVSDHLGFVLAPVAATEKGSAWLWSWALAIPHSSRYKKEATEFITWATSKNYIELVAKNHGWVAAPPGTRKSTYENKNYLKDAPFAAFVRQAIEGANVNDSTLNRKPYVGIQYVGIPEFPAIGNQVGLQIMKALKEEQSVEEALAQSQSIVYQQMQDSGYIK